MDHAEHLVIPHIFHQLVKVDCRFSKYEEVMLDLMNYVYYLEWIISDDFSKGGDAEAVILCARHLATLKELVSEVKSIGPISDQKLKDHLEFMLFVYKCFDEPIRFSEPEIGKKIIKLYIKMLKTLIKKQ